MDTYNRYNNNTKEGWYSIRSLNYDVNNDTGFINVNTFETDVNPNKSQNVVHDLRNGSIPFRGLLGMNSRKKKATMGLLL